MTSAKILDGTIAASDIDATQGQRRVQSACRASQLMTGVNQDGSVLCQAVSSGAGGDITAVIAGSGLSGGAPSGDATLAVAFAGPGSAALVARADHTHATTGLFNTAVGLDALRNNIGGSSNSALGAQALRNVTGGSNSAFGSSAGLLTTTGSRNTFVGENAGDANTTGNNNTVLGQGADLGAPDLTNASAIGQRAQVASSNSLVLGSINGVNGSSSDTNVGIGTTSPSSTLDIESESASAALRVTSFQGPATLSARTARGNRLAPTPVQDGDALLQLESNGYTGSGFSSNGAARFSLQATETWTATASSAAT